MSGTTPVPTRDGLVGALTEIAQAGDDRWVDVVMDVVDELAHREVADVYCGSENRPGETGDDVYERLHAAADRTRVRFHNVDTVEVADWLIARLGNARRSAG